MIQCGQFAIDFDRDGFPLVRHHSWGFFIGLLPVSKYQFERFLVNGRGTAHGLTEGWYRSHLSNNPRCPWRDWGEMPWKLFMTGLGTEGVDVFFRHLGKGYRLPTLQERLMLHNAAPEIAFLGGEILSKLTGAVPAPLPHWLSELDLPLTREGLMEVVCKDRGRCFVGRPWQSLLPNLWDPISEREMYWGVHDQAIGFRVVKGA